jgi:hypothetical protein
VFHIDIYGVLSNLSLFYLSGRGYSFYCVTFCFYYFQSCPKKNSRKKTKNNRQHPGTQDPIECLDHLKELVLRIYRFGDKQELDFAKFFVLNAEVLELMTFSVHYNRHNVDRKQQHKLLKFDSRASLGARVDTIVDYERERFACRNNSHILSMDSPFGSSCEYCAQGY